MTRLSEMSMRLIQSLNFDYVISTVHPENVASNRIMEKLGMELYTTLMTQSGFRRKLY